jgi:hypothetical protein
VVASEDVTSACAKFALGLGFVANADSTNLGGVFGWMIQLGALGLLAWYFLKVEPQQRREEREERRRELELLLRWRDQTNQSKTASQVGSSVPGKGTPPH